MAYALGAASLLTTGLTIATGMGWIKNVRLRQGIQLVTGAIEKVSKGKIANAEDAMSAIKTYVAIGNNPEVNRIVETKVDPKGIRAPNPGA